MIDFIEYVVAELKSKRLSKTKAAALVRQFSRGSSHPGGAAVLHPLLHRNTSDLGEQRYGSTFGGNESFLDGHQVATSGRAPRKVLPAVAYLEMARAALEDAWPERREGTFLELRNAIWAQPVVVTGRKDVSIALLSSGDEQVEFEIYSDDGVHEVVHCQGQAIRTRETAPPPIDILNLRARMTRGPVLPEEVYATCERMGLIYGPAHRAITAIQRGGGELLADLRLPETVAEGAEAFVLHPSLMDGALQAAVALTEAEPGSARPRLPFALETLRVISPCVPEMVAWLRHTPGSHEADKVVKLDIDLCDGRGNVCVQMRGLSWRVLSSEIESENRDRTATGPILATPVWEGSQVEPHDIELVEHHVLSLLTERGKTIAQRYSEIALECFEQIQEILQQKAAGRVLVQFVADDEVLAGLSGLLRTAALENPELLGQFIIVPAETGAEELRGYVAAERRGGIVDSLVKYQNGARYALHWREVEVRGEPPLAFKDSGVYLITGGLGGLGVLFTQAILQETRQALVVLTGRHVLTAERQGRLDVLAGSDLRVAYRQVDLGDRDQVRRLIAGIGDEYGRLDGILHAAGMVADNFIIRKNTAEFEQVLGPKVTGTFHLDEASANVPLDFFVLFSAVAGVMGNIGQADYATANAFLDQFAAYRNRLVSSGLRHGMTRSIDWPLWQAGGMRPDRATEEWLRQTTGMRAMQTATGIEVFHRSLALPHEQILVVDGELEPIRRTFLSHAADLSTPEREAVVAPDVDGESLPERTERHLRKLLSEVLKVPAQKIDVRAALENYGIDSILAMRLTNQLETVFGSLPKTLFFEYQTIRELAGYFIAHHAARLAALVAPATAPRIETALPVSDAPQLAESKIVSTRRNRRRLSATPAAGPRDERIAVIGLSGRYPEAFDLDAYWENLRDGRNCITEVPRGRWDWREYYSEDRTRSGHHYSKWGGFIAGVDEFDPLFFNISPLEAEQIDPQERLFLQHVWMAIEDAGYTRAGLQVPQEQDLPGQVGVYAGVMYTEYQLFGAEALARGRRIGVPGSAASIANRVSYALNLHGPSMTLDTMCSSSLAAIHLACEDLRHGRTSMAIAGGVNVSIHPNKYLVLSDGQFISSDGHCQSFGEGGDGYIPGEGVGVVVLKRLADAERDGDHIYGIIRGSALNHGGKTNGYSVPNPQAQASVISRALAESRVDARHISYVEAHGTGTKLGDPIEIAALSKAFQKHTADAGFCWIGSVKSNVGHCESAAGIAGLTKILLQMRHQQIVPSLHSARLNPHIDFGRSPFIVNQTLRPWTQPVIDGRTLPRLAGISSFGAGGSNAHMIVEEYPPVVAQPAPATVVVPLSARTPEQLQQKARELLAFVGARRDELDLISLAYTLQVGREAMEERLGFVVSSTGELVDHLEAYVAGREQEEAHRGRVNRNDATLALFNTDVHLQQAIEQWIVHRKLPKLLDLWVNGLEVAWSRLYGEVKPRRMSLPTYPFARERYWIDAGTAQPARATEARAVLHPLLHANTSDLAGQRYSTTLTGEEFFLADHQVNARRVLPGVACLEMARAAVQAALPAHSGTTDIELHDTVWAQPVIVAEPTEVHIALVAVDDEQIDYEIYSRDAEHETIHCQGRAISRRSPAPARLDLGRLKAGMALGRWTADRVYDVCGAMGLAYGSSLRSVVEINRGHGQLLAQLRLPESVGATASAFVLHPSLLDGALQACVALMEESGPAQPRLPFALETLRVYSHCPTEVIAWARYAAGYSPTDDLVKLDIDVCDAGGNVCVQMRGLSARALVGEHQAAVAQTLLATPVWQAADAAPSARPIEWAERYLTLCELSSVGSDEVTSLVPHGRCVDLRPERDETIAQRYTKYALSCTERIRAILLNEPEGTVLFQIVVEDRPEQAVFGGLSGLLMTAAREFPLFRGQLIVVPAGITGVQLARYLENESGDAAEPVIRYEGGTRHVRRWQEIPADSGEVPVVYRDDGVYLITGGLGGLGTLFGREILEQTARARVVLTGRGAFPANDHPLLDRFGAHHDRVTYRQVDLGDAESVAQLVGAITEEQGRLDGILHCAGMVADRLLVTKESAEILRVLEPKVTGAFHLDVASRHVKLDFFTLFSSTAGAVGNAGQADYAAANGFLDHFAAYRNALVAAGDRYGRTRSINWPLWQDGGMAIDAAGEEMLQRATGMQPMRTATGMAAFQRSLAVSCDRMLVAEGDLPRLRRALLGGSAMPEATREIQPAAVPPVAAPGLAEKTQDYLRRELAQVLKMPAHSIDPEAPLEKYGIDSILAMKLTNQLEKTFGSLSKTLFFEYQTIAALAGYLLEAYPSVVLDAVGATTEDAEPRASHPQPVDKPRTIVPRRSKAPIPTARAAAERDDIAIVGLAGRYPHAPTLQEFWRNLQNGRDCITEIPAERWDQDLYYDPRPDRLAKSYSKWGGFIDDVDKFDPLFFNISPKEAALIDPQERLFLETAWETIEDAGYSKENISGRRVGVFVGVMWSHYELFGSESLSRGNAALPTSSHASIANRVSYVFDFHGPSIALDTMCSSSLTAIHLACEQLRGGEIDAAIAGGVNVTIHPYKYLTLSQGKFAASDGKCRSFGAGGDGYVPGEGVGAVLLKRLSDAVRDGDQIYAVVKASSINHGGKTNGYTVPNPNAQGDLIVAALEKGHIDPRTLSYVETHGTGTSLGDPIEITGLMKAFGDSIAEKQFCPIGSVKSNIGHLESAAGIAAVTKVLLQLRHEQLVPSLHAEPLNPNIHFEDSPFYVQTELAEWKRASATPRRAGVSSFGAGGSNAHLILEEFVTPREQDRPPAARDVFVLSAKNAEALRRYAERAVRFIDDAPGVSLVDIAYTSRVGRTPMDVRLAVIASNVDELREKLRAWIAGDAASRGDDVFHANIREAEYHAAGLTAGPSGKAFLASLLASGDLQRIAALWVLGAGVDWSLLPRHGSARKVSFPTYPFEKERCWIEHESTPRRAVQFSAVSTSAVSEAVEEKQRLYYFPQWTPKPLAARGEMPAAMGPVLILDSSEELYRVMRELVADQPVVLVNAGESLREIAPNVYTIDPRRDEQFHDLVARLRNANLLPRTILHHSANACDLAVPDAVAQTLDRGLYTLFHLSRALMRAGHREALRIVSLFSSDPDRTAPLSSAMSGFLRTLALENPAWLAKTIDVSGELSLSQACDLIANELADADWTDQEVRYEGHVRAVRTLVPAVQGRTLSTPVPRKNGVYLITGGLGGLGLIFARDLAKQYQARLVLIGRSSPSAAQLEQLEDLGRFGAEVLVLQADVSRLDDVAMVVREAKARFGEIHGVIHAAGVTRDAFVLRKTREEIEAVLSPKIHGAINVDLATREETLDFFVLFSSVAGVMGNPGQSDYAYGNRFLDSFAERREAARRAQQRSGRTLAIDWPLWEEGGMRISSEQRALLEERTGISPLPAGEGIRCWEDLLRTEALQAVALYGAPSRIASFLSSQTKKAHREPAAPAQRLDPDALFSRTESYLKELVGAEIGLSPERIGSADPLESFGLDSVMITRLNARLERDLGALPKTLLYEQETVRDLATYLVREARELLLASFGIDDAPVPPLREAAPREETIRVEVAPAKAHDAVEGIAIIGIHGNYPHSATLAQYWENLKRGRDLIDLVPPNRWSCEELYHPDPAAAADGKIYCKWGGFLDDYDKFDPHFFKIPTAEAKLIDPQERLFLESVWAAVEDSGYTRDRLRARHPKGGSADVGVFVGVTTNSYHLWAPEERMRGNFVSPAAMPWSIANRVSYFFDFNGPSLPVDTACSSSLVAIHLACESLRGGECQVAIAGGVNLYLHPAKYQSLCQRRMLATGGKCRSYGAGDDGFVPGEGIGTVVLKPLGKAIEDGDRVYAVIRASAFDHSGRSNGYSAPNPNAQAHLIARTLAKAAVHPETIDYVEGHGTGTQLGDSIEIAALSNAFRKETARKQFCPIGSVKANIGHSESAAGIAGLTKILLQMEHRQLAPTIYSDEPNPNIEFQESPFYLQHALSDWPSSADHPRRALINSFGAGGVNACLVVEEFEQRRSPAVPQEHRPHVFTLSARNEDRLREYADRLLAWLRSEAAVDLASLCYTLQTGREAMEERLATVVSDVSELVDRLSVWCRSGSAADVCRGSLGPRRSSRRAAERIPTDPEKQTLLEVASRWAAGDEVEWESGHPEPRPERISLPTYPFARERYWITDDPAPERPAHSISELHPLITRNSSTLKEINFSSSLPDTAFYAVDHEVHGERIFPGAGFLEMACIAANMAGERRVRKIRDVFWIRPLSFRTGAQPLRTVLRHADGVVQFVISSFGEENEDIVHSEGTLVFGNGVHSRNGEDRISLQALKSQCEEPQDGAACYDRFREHGLRYGPSFRTIQELYRNDTFALAKLTIAEHLKGDFGRFILHPSIVDGALQTIAGLFGGSTPRPHVPFALDEIELLKPLPATCYAYAENADGGAPDRNGLARFDIRLLNESGDVLVRFRNLYVRPLAEALAVDRPRPADQGRLLSMSGAAID